MEACKQRQVQLTVRSVQDVAVAHNGHMADGSACSAESTSRFVKTTHSSTRKNPHDAIGRIIEINGFLSSSLISHEKC